MSCEEIENQIPDYQEDQLSAAARMEVETHLAGCARCRTFARGLFELDAALSSRIRVPALSAGFDRRLRDRIQVGSAAERIERKRQLQAEFEAGRARINHGFFGLDSVMSHLAWPTLAIAAGWLAWRLTLPLAVRLNAQSLGGLDPILVPWLAASAVFLIVSLADALPRKWKSAGF